ncbi:hypothetical protein SUGI_0278370 [Cryptomeria japonica]|uniref:nudix hydrolase 10 n=1 Tax=Cryptomeria japonica TaxID=3369 RepID=UPI002408A06A|nr:nudix hydrolase 10 [Cryptomeria japonica]GLJ16406.1 hypothetical protein SUGI_0278370 [Cryptomeria japonica]
MMVALSIHTSLTRSISNSSEVFCKRSRILEYFWRVQIRKVGFCACKIGYSISSFKTNLSGYTTSGIFRIVQPCTKKFVMSYSKKQPLAPSPLPSEDESLIEDRKIEEVLREPFEQEEGILPAQDDEYDGVIVDPNNLPYDVNDFISSLKVSLSKWRKQGKKGVWIKVPITHAKLVPAAIEEGFWYHHAEPTYMMLTYWIPQTPCTLPPNASHQVGVGGFVLNDQNQVLVVQEKYGPFRGTGVWKIPTGVIHQGEDIFTGAIREIKEETGVDTQFIELVGFRHSHHATFEKSDLFFLCILRPISFEIVVQELEIDKAQWMPLEDFVSQSYYENSSLKKMLEICIASSKKIYSGFSAVQTKSTTSNLPTVSYYNIADNS